MECVGDFEKRREKMLPRKRANQRSRIPQMLNGQGKKLRKDMSLWNEQLKGEGVRFVFFRFC